MLSKKLFANAIQIFIINKQKVDCKNDVQFILTHFRISVLLKSSLSWNIIEIVVIKNRLVEFVSNFCCFFIIPVDHIVIYY